MSSCSRKSFTLCGLVLCFCFRVCCTYVLDFRSTSFYLSSVQPLLSAHNVSISFIFCLYFVFRFFFILSARVLILFSSKIHNSDGLMFWKAY